MWAAWAAIAVAWPLAEQRQLERSAQLLGAALAFLDTAGAGRDWMDDVCKDAVREILRNELGEHTAQALLDKGGTLPLEQAARDALDEPTER